MSAARAAARGRVPLGPRRARRGDAAARPGRGRIATTRTFDAWEGGGEYNVARGLRRCFGLRTAVVTALADNPVGRLVEDLMLQGGVDPSHLALGAVRRRRPRGPQRAQLHRARLRRPRRASAAPTAATPPSSQLRPGDVDWDAHLRRRGRALVPLRRRLLRAVGERPPAVAREAMEAARAHGTIVSYDLNYRESLWKAIGGTARRARSTGSSCRSSTSLFGNEEDFSAALGFEVEGVDERTSSISTPGVRSAARAGLDGYPHLGARRDHAAPGAHRDPNDWSAVCRTRDASTSDRRCRLEIFDRVGGGDSFASGLFYGLLQGSACDSARYGVAPSRLTASDSKVALLVASPAWRDLEPGRDSAASRVC